MTLAEATVLTATYSDLEERYKSAISRCIAGLPSDWEVTRRSSGQVASCQAHFKGKPLPCQGWKIHVSACASEAVRLCDDVFSWVLSQGVTCKILGDIASILRVNSGFAGETQTGKILTIYPSDDTEAADLALELDRRWPASEGPAVPSDLALRAQGAVFLRYGSFDGDMLVDRFGKVLSAVRTMDGAVIEDLRSVYGGQPAWANPPLSGLLPAVSEIAESIAVGSESYLPLALLHASPHGRVFSGLRLSDASEVLIKVRRRGVGDGLFGSSAEERLGAENAVLSALQSSQQIAPQPLGFLKGGEFTVLVTEHIEGQRFADIDIGHQVSSLPALAMAISKLHGAGFVHRDIKLANAIVTAAGIRLVDFELAAAVGSEALLQAGTRGYMPPETQGQVDGAVDVYALGACVAHVYLGFDPASLPDGGGRLVGLLTLFGFARVAHVVRSLMHRQPQKRPSAKAATQMLEGLQCTTAHLTLDQFASTAPRHALKTGWCLRTAREAGLACRRFQRDVKCGLAWRSRQYEGVHAIDGINIGAAGVILGLASIDRASGCSEFSKDIQGGARWLASQKPNEAAHGFFTGNAGVALALGVVGRRFGCSEWINEARIRLRKAVTVEHDCDLFSGKAGVLWAACLLGEILEDLAWCELAAHCGESLIQLSEVRDGLRVWPPSDATDPLLTGAAHGSAGVALALATWGRMTGRSEAVDLALETFERLFRNGRSHDGTMLRRAVDGGSSWAPVLPWCHGVAGYVWSMLSAFGDDDRLAPAIDWSLERCAAARPSGNPVYCHGGAGELELWRLAGKYSRLAGGAEHGANRAASVLRFQLQRQSGLCVWSAEDPEIVTPDLWVGFLGPATALALYARRVNDPLLSGAWLGSCAVPKQ